MLLPEVLPDNKSDKENGKKTALALAPGNETKMPSWTRNLEELLKGRVEAGQV